MMVSDGLIENKCHGCGETYKTAGFELQHIYMWSNQYGKKMRFFCHRCGEVHDVTELKGKLIVEKHSMKCAKFRDNSKYKTMMDYGLTS